VWAGGGPGLHHAGVGWPWQANPAPGRNCCHASGFYAWYTLRAARVAVESGTITEEERRAWVAAFEAKQADGRLLVGLTHLSVWGTRPA
jgi:hypothetical protein